MPASLRYRTTVWPAMECHTGFERCSIGVVFDVKAPQKTLWTCDQVEEKPKTDTKKKDGLWVKNRNKEQRMKETKRRKKIELAALYRSPIYGCFQK